MADLKRLFGLREMAVNVPDKDVPGLKRAIAAAVNSKILPPEANGWVSAQPPAGAKPADQGGAKKAPAVGKKAPAPAAKPGDDAFFSDFKKGLEPKPAPATKATPNPVDTDMEDDWSQGEPDVYDPKKATRGAEADADEPEPQAPSAWGGKHKLPARRGADDSMPSFAGSDAFQSQNAPSLSAGADDDGDVDYKSPFGAMSGGGGSSWDDVPNWMRDPERMPHASGGGMKIPGARDDAGAPSKAKKQKGQPPSPVGKPWSAKDVKGSPDDPKKPGVLSRLFGRKK
jgi:hypothetical protein